MGESYEYQLDLQLVKEISIQEFTVYHNVWVIKNVTAELYWWIS